MKIKKVEKLNSGFHKVHIEHNNCEGYYILEYSLDNNFQKELDQFMRTFFDNGECNWREVMDDKDVIEFFENSFYIKNDRGY